MFTRTVRRLGGFVIDLSGLSVVFAAYGTPATMAIQRLFARHVPPRQIGLLTHQQDARNQPSLEFARLHHIDTATFDPRSDDAHAWVAARRPVVLFSIYYPLRIPEQILALPAYGCVNLHPALLPNYRGCFSISHAIINGESASGYTYHYMVEAFDAGNIIAQQSIPIEDTDTGFSLYYRVTLEALNAFDAVVDRVVIDRDPGTPQPDGGRYYSSDIPYGGVIDPQWDESRIERFIRAMNFPPYKGAVARLGGKEYEVDSLEAYLSMRAEVSS